MSWFCAIALFAFLPFGELPVGDVNVALRSDWERGTISVTDVDLSQHALVVAPRFELELLSDERRDAKVRYPVFSGTSWLLFAFTLLGAYTVREGVNSLLQIISWIVIALLVPLVVHSWKCSDS